MIKRPGNEFVIVDQSGKYTTTETPELAPLMLTAASFDRGPEGLIEVSGDDFFRMYGENISFDKHGQPAIQAANIIRNGGKLLIKRVVAADAELANVICTATVKKVEVPKVDPITKRQIYIDKDTGMETTESKSTSGQNDRAVINTAEITYNVVTVGGAKTFREIQLAAKDLIVEKDQTIETPDVEDDTTTPPENEGIAVQSARAGRTIRVKSAIPANIPFPLSIVEDTGNDNESEYTYPLFIITENGRGVSSKRFKIEPDYATSKNLDFVLYKITNIGSLYLDNEYTRFALDPDTIYNGQNLSLSESGKDMQQIRAAAYNEGISKFIDKVSEFSGIERSELLKLDIIFGNNKRGESVEQITINPDGYDFTSDFGITLQSGSNGSFGSHPFGTEAYTQALLEFYSGKYDPAIFDVDQYKIEACIDANYPMEVKQEITTLVNFRKDFFFFRDLGLNMESHFSIALAAKALPDSMYAANYCQSYDIMDPFSKRQITVTISYDIARLLITHLNERRNCPFCGELYSVNMPNVIEGTTSYIPRIMPNVDQKQDLYDIHMNYASVVNGVLTLETQVDSQTDETQCSWINNILTVQNIIRDVRTLCPKVRYSFINQASGLERYAQDVTNVLKLHTEEVDELEFEWSSDPVELKNHIFNATINVKFKEYVDFERFLIYVFD